jgi:hypothetical protein
MNPQLNYTMVHHCSGKLRRAGERARLATEVSAKGRRLRAQNTITRPSPEPRALARISRARGRAGNRRRPMKKHVVIVGAGFAGLELATRLSESLREAVHVTPIDRNDSFYFGFSKLDVMLGRQAPTDVLLLPRHRQRRSRVPPGDRDSYRPAEATRHHRRGLLRRRLPRGSAGRGVTWPRRLDSSRAGLSTTRSPAPSGCATPSLTSRGGRS